MPRRAATSAAIRNGEFEIKGRSVPVSNRDIPASIYCICDLTPTFRRVLKVLDAFVTPDNQGYYGFHGASTLTTR
jgi:hypothetical protein